MGVSLLLREETTWKGRTLSSTFSVNKKNKKKWFMFYSGHRRTAWKELKRFLEALRLLTRIAQFFHHPLSSFLLNFGWLICSEHLFPAQTWYHIEQLEKHQRSQPGGIAAKLGLRTTKQMLKAKQNRLGSKKKTRKEAALSNRKGRKRAEGEGRDKNQVRSLNGRDVNSCTCLLTTLTEQGDFHTAILMGFLILEDPARPSGLSKVQFVHLYPSHFIHPPLLQLLRRQRQLIWTK